MGNLTIRGAIAVAVALVAASAAAQNGQNGRYDNGRQYSYGRQSRDYHFQRSRDRQNANYAQDQNGGIQVTVNGNPVQFDAAQPQMIDGRVFVPIRGVFEQMGANVDWDPSSQTVMADGHDRHVRLTLNSVDASVNGRVVTMDTPPQLVEDTTMVPLRFLSEALGGHVDWQPQNDLVAITFHEHERAEVIQPTPPPPPPQPQIIVKEVPAPAPPPQVIVKEVPAPPPPFEISRDMVIPLILDETISSRDSQPGERFTATIEDNANHLGFPAGTVVEGRVRDATPASGSHGGKLDLRFYDIRFPDGAKYDIGGVVTPWDDKYIFRTDKGRFMAKSQLDWRALDTDRGAELLTRTGKVAIGGSAVGGTLGQFVGIFDHGMGRNVIFNQGTRMALVLNGDLRIDAKDMAR